MFRNSRSIRTSHAVSFGLVGCALLALSAPSRAAVYTVTDLSDGDPGSLRQAILTASANPGAGGDTIQFAPNVTGTISLTSGALQISGNLTIVGPGAKLLTVDAGSSSSVLYVGNSNPNYPPFSVTVQGLTMSHGHSGWVGGGIQMAQNTTLTLEDCAMTYCNAQEDGGSIFEDQNCTLTARRCLFFNCGAGHHGGGVCVNSGATLENCTFAANAAYNGGAIASNGQVIMESCTVAGANWAYNGGGVTSFNGAITLHNNIIAGNVAVQVGPDVWSGVISQGYNLIGNPADSGGFGATDLLNVDPNLGSLADNGGPTQTFALLSGSAAIDAADPLDFPDTDQRGISRPQGLGADIGAFEAVLLPTQIVAVIRNSDGTITVKVAVSNATANTADDVTVTGGTLGGVDTTTPLPQHHFTIKPGDSKQVVLQFPNVPSGATTLVVQGSSSLGVFSTTLAVTAP